ncbi:hypothetical protein [Streptomyces sp. Z26]|uniref:hypothetical protein n=1 Tax=Streptomyces sp. Z26 TaxID=2500177 RepID=UPI001F0C3D51|nr:hypothetical protein [Streptomyces sp. Z26]
MPETATGPWKPTWSPGDAGPGLSPLTVVHDRGDDYAFMAAALAAHTSALGRITVHPTPVASAPASLAHDLLRSLGKHLPLTGSEDGAYWTGSTETAWRAVAAWILALRIGHVIVTRAHRISSRHFEYLFALAELTRIRLTLLCHGPLPPALAAALATLPHEEADTLAAAHRALAASAPSPPAGRFAWWEAGEPFPPREGEPCFLLPTRRTPGRGVIEAAVRRLGCAVLPLPAAGRFPSQPDEPTVLLARRLHTRIAHPVHAAALAVRIFTGCPATQLQWPAAHTTPPARQSRGPERPAPTWAVDLIEAGRRFGQLEGRQHSARPLRLSPWDQTAVTEAAHACGLHEHHGTRSGTLPRPRVPGGRPAGRPRAAARAAHPRRAGQHEAGKHNQHPHTHREQTMTEPGTELFEAIRRDHRAGDRLPRSLAARHGVARATVKEAISAVLPLPHPLPVDEEGLDQARQFLDALLEEDQAKAPEERRSAFELYEELDRRTDGLPVSYRWVWEYITDRRSQQHADIGSPVPHERTWAGNVPSDMPEFVTDLITCAVRHLTELKIEGTLPAADGVELGMVSFGTARARIDQALWEFALVGRRAGLSYARLSAFTGVPEEDLAQQVERYDRLMTS